jgi:NitT/TauT family transport system substrate-binding protein
MRKPGIQNIISIITIILILPGCKNEERTDSILTATLKGPSAMAMIHMIESTDSIGNLPAEFIIKNEPRQAQAMMLEESIDFAVLPSTLGALLYNKTGNYILAGIPVWGTLYLFGSDTSINTWDDLKGKKVSLMGRGMTPDIMFRYLAERNRLDPDRDMELDYSFPTHIELANAISAGVSKLGVISEPLVSLVMARNSSVLPLIDFNREWISLFGPDVPFAQTALLVHRNFAKEHPEIVNEYLKELNKSIQRVNDFTHEAARLIVKHNILPDSSIAVRSIPRSNLHFSYAGEEMNGIHEYFKVFYNFNPLILGGKLPDEEFYYKKKPD